MGTFSRVLTYVQNVTPEVQAELYGNTILLMTGLLGLAVTGGVALWQLRSQREEAARDRALTLKKEVLLEAVRGAYEVHTAIGALGNLATTPEEIGKTYQTGASKLVAAGAVASLKFT